MNKEKLSPHLLLGLVLFIMPHLSLAVEIIVNILTDSGRETIHCEFHSATNAVVVNVAVDGCPAGGDSDVIVFNVTGLMELTRDIPMIVREVQINGPGNYQPAISGVGNHPVFPLQARVPTTRFAISR